MRENASAALKWAYCFILFFGVIPIGMGAGSIGLGSLVGGAISKMMPAFMPLLIPLFGILPILLLVLYRIYLVVRIPGTLSSYPVTGFARVLRKFGEFAIYLGTICFIGVVAMGLFMLMSTRSRTESGAEYFVISIYLFMSISFGIWGLICYELSRLIGFEHQGNFTKATTPMSKQVTSAPKLSTSPIKSTQRPAESIHHQQKESTPLSTQAGSSSVEPSNPGENPPGDKK